ncbi:hypothetical protein GCM10023153_28910 [Ornithinibacter aureus]|uniref:Uncharacterized protein n=1 Tax=Ornithinibacter aureus TaxID=622664 RepID=A0ABP8K6M9_9MICO
MVLVIPPHAPDGSLDPIVVRAAEEYCRERHAVSLLDSPPTWTSAQDVLAAHEAGLDAVVGASRANVALIFPRLGDRLSATGAVAGVIARTDARTGGVGLPGRGPAEPRAAPRRRPDGARGQRPHGRGDQLPAVTARRWPRGVERPHDGRG